MKKIAFAMALAALVLMPPITPQSFADPGTTFTYQGQLADGGVAIDTAVDLRFTLYDADTGGTALGSPITLNNVSYADGVVQEDLDFGAQFDGSPRWLEVELANPTGGSFTILTPRIEMKPVPYAMYAEMANAVLNDAVDDADADPANELQSLSYTSPTMTLAISGGNSVDLSSLIPSVPDNHSLDADDGDPVDAVYVDAEGNVGIGTTSPGAMLDVGGSLLLQGGTETAVDQEQLDTNSGLSTEFDFWQSFTAGQSGNLESVSLLTDPNGGEILGYSLYEGEGTGGTLLASVTEARSLGGGVWEEFAFPTAPAILAGSQYTLFIHNNGVCWLEGASGDKYTGGRCSANSSLDLTFRTYVEAPASRITFADGTTQTTAYPGSVDDANGSSLDASDGSPTDVVQVDNFGQAQVGGSGILFGQAAQVRFYDGGLQLATRPTVLDQSQEDSNGYIGAASGAWQSFTAGITGQLASVEVKRNNNTPQTTARIYEGQGSDGAILAETMLPALTTGLGWQTIAFPASIDLTSGQQYSIWLEQGDGWRLQTGNLYAGGRYSGGNLSDAVFRTYMLDTSSSDAFAAALHIKPTDQHVGIGTINPSSELEVDGTVTATAFVGDGSGLTGLTDSSSTNELQTLSGSGSEVTLSDGGGTVYVSGLASSDGGVTDAALVDAYGVVQVGGSGVLVGQTGQLRSFDNGLELATRPTVLDQSQTAATHFLTTSSARWQSFTAGISGELTGIEVRRQQPPDDAIVVIYEGEGTSGARLATGMVPADPGSNNWQFAAFAESATLTAGQQYTIWLSTSNRWRHSVEDPYVGGRASHSASSDYQFRTYMLDSSSDGVFTSAVHVNTADQRVGIGTTSPSSELDVNGTVTATAFVGDGSGLTGLTDNVNDADADPTNELQTLSGSGSEVTLSNSGGTLNVSALASKYGGTPSAVYVDASGNVGIGTTSPRHTIDMKDGIAIRNNYELDQANETHNTYLLPNGATNGAQLFKPSVSGKLLRIQVLTDSSNSRSTGVCNFYSGTSESGATLLGSTTYALPTGVQDWAPIDFATPIDVTAGNSYFFKLIPDSASHRIRASSHNSYANGHWIANTGYDLAFRTYMQGDAGILFADDTFQSTAFSGNLSDYSPDSFDVNGTVTAQEYVSSNGGLSLGSLGQVRIEEDGLQLATRTPILDQENDTGSDYLFGSSAWQSFTPSVSGNLVAFSLMRSSNAATSGIATLYEGEGTGGTKLAEAPIFEPDHAPLWQTAVWPTPVSVTAGQQYTVEVVVSTSIRWLYKTTDSYAGGRASYDPTFDFRFRTYMLDSSADFTAGVSVLASNQFVGILNPSPAYPLEVGTDTTNGNGAHVTTGGTWTNGSSRTWKTNFRTLDPKEVLEQLDQLPILRWDYTGSDEGDHVGPMAEDFYAAFGLGNNEKYISTVDADGVNMAAIQGLNRLLKKKDTEIEQLRVEKDAQIEDQQNQIDDLQARLAKLEAMMNSQSSTK